VTFADLVQLLHVLAAFWFVAGLLGRDVILGLARRAADMGTVQTLVAVAGPFDRLMVIPGSMAVLVLGILTWWVQHLPLWGDGTRWVTVSLIVFATSIPLVPLIFLPHGRVFEAALSSAIAQGRVTPELSAALHDPMVEFAHWYERAVVAVVLVLMVTKPF
jgi:uncharacterized membrane protein